MKASALAKARASENKVLQRGTGKKTKAKTNSRQTSGIHLIKCLWSIPLLVVVIAAGFYSRTILAEDSVATTYSIDRGNEAPVQVTVIQSQKPFVTPFKPGSSTIPDQTHHLSVTSGTSQNTIKYSASLSLSSNVSPNALVSLSDAVSVTTTVFSVDAILKALSPGDVETAEEENVQNQLSANPIPTDVFLPALPVVVHNGQDIFPIFTDFQIITTSESQVIAQGSVAFPVLAPATDQQSAQVTLNISPVSGQLTGYQIQVTTTHTITTSFLQTETIDSEDNDNQQATSVYASSDEDEEPEELEEPDDPQSGALLHTTSLPSLITAHTLAASHSLPELAEQNQGAAALSQMGLLINLPSMADVSQFRVW